MSQNLPFEDFTLKIGARDSMLRFRWSPILEFFPGDSISLTWPHSGRVSHWCCHQWAQLLGLHGLHWQAPRHLPANGFIHCWSFLESINLLGFLINILPTFIMNSSDQPIRKPHLLWLFANPEILRGVRFSDRCLSWPLWKGLGEQWETQPCGKQQCWKLTWLQQLDATNNF